MVCVRADRPTPWQAVAGLLERGAGDAERALAAALDTRKLNQAAAGLLAGPAGRSASVPAAKRQVQDVSHESLVPAPHATGSHQVSAPGGTHSLQFQPGVCRPRLWRSSGAEQVHDHMSQPPAFLACSWAPLTKDACTVS